MKREYHRWYSPRLGLELGVVMYGHWGPPLLGFPTSAGDEWELEGQSMVGALAPFIDAGRIKFYTVNSINGLSFYNKSAHPFHRSYVQSVFDSYLREEVVPFIWDTCQARVAIATMGASFGAYHAANTLFKHPDIFKRCFAMSGVYDLRNFMDGLYDDNFYFNNPVDYLANLSDPWIYEPTRLLRHPPDHRHRPLGTQRPHLSPLRSPRQQRHPPLRRQLGPRRRPRLALLEAPNGHLPRPTLLTHL